MTPRNALSDDLTFGEYFRALRLTLGFSTVREFCTRHRLDPGYISKMERGLLPPPPTIKRLGKLTSAVGLKEQTAEWQEFLDRAYAARGEIPPDIAGRAEVVRTLPALFRELRNRSLLR